MNEQVCFSCSPTANIQTDYRHHSQNTAHRHSSRDYLNIISCQTFWYEFVCLTIFLYFFFAFLTAQRRWFFIFVLSTFCINSFFWMPCMMTSFYLSTLVAMLICSKKLKIKKKKNKHFCHAWNLWTIGLLGGIFFYVALCKICKCPFLMVWLMNLVEIGCRWQEWRKVFSQFIQCH